MKKISALFLIITLAFAPASWAKLNIQHWQTSKGANVYFVPVNRLPIVDIRLVFAAGSVRDENLYGLAQMTNALLDTAAAGKDAQTIAQQLEDVGAQISNGSLREMAWYQLRTLSYKKQMDVATRVLSEVIGQPDFVASEFDRIKKSMLISLKESKQSPEDIASRAFYKALYGSHPYANSPDGTEKTLEAILLSDVKDFYHKYYVAKNATIVLVGDLKRPAAEFLAEQLVAGLKAGNAANPLPAVEPLAMAKTEYIDFPSKQTHVLVGQPGLSRKDPDYFTLYVANHILGGSGFTSRILEEVREKRGLAYSAYSYFSPMAQKGPFIMGLQTKNDQVEKAINVLMDTLNEFIDMGPTQKELDASLSNITGSAALRTDSNKKIAEYVAMIGFYHLPLDYLDKLNDNFRKVTIEKINKAVKQRLHSQKMVTIVVGNTREQAKK